MKRLPSKPIRPDITYEPTRKLSRVLYDTETIDTKNLDSIIIDIDQHWEDTTITLCWEEPYSKEKWAIKTKKTLALYRQQYSSYMAKLKKHFSVKTNLEALIELKRLEEERKKKIKEFRENKNARERIRLEKEIAEAQRKLKALT